MPKPSNDGTIPCLMCQGSKLCPVCRGVPPPTTDQPGEPPCVECKGTGECPYCNGKGVIPFS